MRTRPHVLLILATLGACAAPDVSGLLDRYGDHVGSILALSCQCPEELGFSNMIECSDALGDVGSAERACLTEVATGHEAEVEAYLECMLPGLEDYEDCLRANESCGEGLYELCVGAFEEAETDCPALPSSIESTFAECTGL